jgi:nucleoside-diphosphate-sugar epimerase
MHSNKKILVTGSDGFIGQHLVTALVELGYQVVTADKKSKTDLCDWPTVKSLPDVDIVFHAAAFNGTRFFYQNPYSVIRNNTLPTQYLLDRYAGNCEHFIFTGTCESYAGAVDRFDWPVPTDESVPVVIDDVLNPRWSYGGSKALGELMCVGAHVELEQPYTILRYHNIYGPGQVDHFIPEFAQRADLGNTELYGYSNTRSFMYVSDAVDITLQLINTPLNQIVNIGSDYEITIKDLATMILQLKNISTPLVCKPAPTGSVSRRCPDLSRLKSLIKYNPLVDLHQGVKLTLESL